MILGILIELSIQHLNTTLDAMLFRSTPGSLQVEISYQEWRVSKLREAKKCDLAIQERFKADCPRDGIECRIRSLQVFLHNLKLELYQKAGHEKKVKRRRVGFKEEGKKVRKFRMEIGREQEGRQVIEVITSSRVNCE